LLYNSMKFNKADILKALELISLPGEGKIWLPVALLEMW